jgi:DNA-binding MurR/RpiR family transcriptional regulator
LTDNYPCKGVYCQAYLFLKNTKFGDLRTQLRFSIFETNFVCLLFHGKIFVIQFRRRIVVGAITELENLTRDIAKYAQNVSGAKRTVALHILQHLEDMAFVTLDEVAKVTQISASTITRTVSAMGFKGYPEFQEEIREIIKMKLLPAERSRMLPPTESTQNYMTSLRYDRENLEVLETLNSVEKFEQAVELLVKAKSIHLCGMQASYGTISVFANYLSQIRPGVSVVRLTEMALSEQILDFTKQDVFFLLSLPQYHSFAIGLAEEALKKGCSLLSVTDSPHSPIGLKSDVAFAVPYKSASFFNSHVAACSLLGVLITGVNCAIKKKALERLTQHEEQLRRWKLYVEMSKDK